MAVAYKQHDGNYMNASNMGSFIISSRI